MKSHIQTKSNYRADIDGLRAVAVLGVLIYHISPKFLSGGFLGVDIFFVISGYLITKHLQEAIHSSNFSILNFYDRRIRRILPALIVLVIVVAFVGLFVLIPVPEYRNLGQSISATASLCSNVYFYFKSDYFAGLANETPLLHTWSLGIEEQFYLIWPIGLWLIMRLKKIQIQKLIVVTFFVSSLYYSQHLATVNPSAAFYWPMSRFWELLAGALLSFNMLPAIKKGSFSHLIANISITIIILSFIVFNETMPLPGYLSLLPIVATVLFIHTNQNRNHSIASRCLTTKPALFVGLISYSLYLWHWPILVFMRIIWPSLSIIQALVAIALSFLSAYLSYKYIEQPIRKRTILKNSSFSVAIPALAALFIFGVGAHTSWGFIERVPQEVRTTSLYFAPDPGAWCRVMNDGQFGNTKNLKYKILLIGDSHALDICPVLDRIGNEIDIQFITQIRPGCRPYRSKVGPIQIAQCNDIFEKVMTELPNVDAVIMAASWNLAWNDGPSDIVKIEVANSIQQIASQKPVLIVGDIPAYSENASQCRLRANLLERLGIKVKCDSDAMPRTIANKQQEFILNAIKTINDKNIIFLDRLSHFCNDVTCNSMSGKIPFYRDANHLTAIGASLSYPDLRKIILELLNTDSH